MSSSGGGRMRIQVLTPSSYGQVDTLTGHIGPLGFTEHIVATPSDTEEILRRLGLEYKTADYLHGKRTIIIIEPYADDLELSESRRVIEAVRGLVDDA